MWQGDDGILAGDTGDPAVKVFTARSQDRAMSTETPVFHHHRHITQDVLLSLRIQTLQNVGAVHCRLEGEHRCARSLERHSSYKLSLCKKESHMESTKCHDYTRNISLGLSMCIIIL